jgi:transposase
MSLHLTPIGPIPDDTARIARAAFPKGNAYMRMRDVLGVIYDDVQFADLFAVRGRPAEAPWRLALITVMQFAEGLSDRQAAEAVRARIDWKYALGLELTDPGFDFSVLCEFRARLVAGAAELRLLEALLAACQRQGLLKARGRQRTDSTHVLGALRVLSRLERVAETLRAALNAVATVAPEWLWARAPADWFERYGRRIEEYRLPRGQEARRTYALHVGADGQRLLDAVAAETAPEVVHSLPQIAVLRTVWAQHYSVGEDGQLLWRDPKALPSAAEIIESPYDPEARYATKRDLHWVGYKVHLTETCDDELPHLITDVATTIATATDVAQLPAIQDALAGRELAPSEHVVDAGYVRASNVLSSHERHGIDLVGPVDQDHQWQTRVEGGFTTDRFHIDWDQRQAICPRGCVSQGWCETHTARQRNMIHIRWSAQDCDPCPDRVRCTRAKTGTRARCIMLQSRTEYEALQAGRARQATPEFAAQYARRAGIEGTLSQGVRTTGLRRTRYRGLAKTQVHEVASATAINLGRLSCWLDGDRPISVRRSAFACLALAS